MIKTFCVTVSARTAPWCAIKGQHGWDPEYQVMKVGCSNECLLFSVLWLH